MQNGKRKKAKYIHDNDCKAGEYGKDGDRGMGTPDLHNKGALMAGGGRDDGVHSLDNTMQGRVGSLNMKKIEGKSTES